MIKDLEIRGAKHEEVHKFLTLLENVENNNEEARKIKLLIKARYPYFPSEYIRVAISNSEIIAGLLILPEFIKLGEARLRVVILSKTFSSKIHNYKGIASRIIRDSLNYAEKHRFNFTLIFNVSRIYQRFGFVPIFFEYHRDLRLRKKDLKEIDCSLDYKIRKIKPSDISIIQKIHDICDENTNPSLLRTHTHYSLRWNEIKNGMIIYDIFGKVCGYFFFKIEWKQIMTIEEMGVISQEYIKPSIFYILKWAEKFNCEYIRFLAPDNFQVFEWLEGMNLPLSPTSISRYSIGMAAIHNLEETFQCLVPEWERALHLSNLRSKDIELTFLIDSVPYNIFIRKGDILISNRIGKNKVSINKDYITMLMMGLESGESLINEGVIGISEEAKQFLKVLFPKRSPYIWSLDRT